ncbi:hypothetical protein BKA56DRAFT_638553 [Ilyonectria sp. MPI-CAGE-AT-0026]|nr:hypothetical protein BKA56DRAFT_638553 [Ilyonectria sp. MPI-CAGE-AT-0026]
MLVLIAGISGNMGKRLAIAATTRGLEVRGIGRDASNVPDGIDLESFVTSTSYYDVPAIEKAVNGVDAIICAYASTPVLDLDAHLILLRAAERAGIKIFVSASWNNDWTKNRLGEFEHYDAHIAFRHHAAITSPIKPVYLLNGFFADLLFTPAGPGGFDATSHIPALKYWGDDPTLKFWWTSQDDAAAWTIEILFNEDVQDGKGGVFRFRSGEVSLKELATAYHKATGTKVKAVCAGSIEDIEQQALALNAFKGVWTITPGEVTNLDHAKQPTVLDEYLSERFQIK